MNYHSWYHEKYVGTQVGLKIGSLVTAVNINDCYADGCDECREDIKLLLVGEGIEDWFNVTDERIVYKLPRTDRLYLNREGRLFRVQKRVQHQWRYGFRSNMARSHVMLDGRWQEHPHEGMLDDMYRDRREGVDTLLTTMVGVSDGKVYTTNDMIGFYRNNGVLLLEEFAEEYLEYLIKEGVVVHAYVKLSESNTEAPHLYRGGGGVGKRPTNEWEQLLAM